VRTGPPLRARRRSLSVDELRARIAKRRLERLERLRAAPSGSERLVPVCKITIVIAVLVRIVAL
jgi:hypothetical protein